MKVRGGAGKKLAFFRRSARLLSHRVKPRVWTFAPRDGGEGRTRHCIVLHGWALDQSGIGEMRDALRNLPECAGRRFWAVRYDTQWTHFQESARQIAAELRKQPYQFEDVILVGYSMGGIVAREMVAQGFPCSALLALCVPHDGPLPWLNFPGPRSLRASCPELQLLNANQRDRQHRDRYHLFGITYTDIFGYHPHDGLVPHESAIGANLGTVASRHTTHLNYDQVAVYDPHWRGKQPECMPEVLRVMAAIERGEKMPASTALQLSYGPYGPRHNSPEPRPPIPPGTEPGDLLLFCRARGLNRIITCFTGSRYYHVGIYEEGTFVVEARPRGVVRRDLNGPDGDRQFVVARPPGDKKAALAWAVAQIGDGYDPLDVLVIVLERIFRSLKINYRSDDRYSCGEFVAKAFLEAGTRLFPGRDTDAVIPGDFEKFLGERI